MASVFFFYGNTRIEVEQEVLTGSQIKGAIKTRVDSFDPSQDLVLEGEGHHADRVIADDETVDLGHGHSEQGPDRFFSRPPTNFGQG